MKLIAVLLLLAGSAAYCADEPDLVARYLDYRNLTRLTEEEIDLTEGVRGFCLDPKFSWGPHIKPGLHIYANEVASRIGQLHRFGP